MKEFLGVFEQAKKRWQKGVAVGRLSVARSDKCDTRLCFDRTIPNVNAKVQMEDNSFNPCVDDIVSAKAVTHLPEGVGLTIDVRKAHKRLRIREDEWRLLMFQHRGKLYHYTVCHCGTRFSAAWWSRMGAVLIRLCHQFLFPFGIVGGCTSMTVSLCPEVQRAPLIVSCTFWDVPSAGTKLSWDGKHDELASTSTSSRVSGKYRKTKESKP